MEQIQQQLRELQEQNAALHLQLQQRTQPAPATQVSPQVHRVGVKLPVFWPYKTALWFAQADAQFSIANITQDATKYSYIVSHLDSRYAADVEDIILNPPAQDAYTHLRTELIRRLSLSEEQRVRQLLMEEELGDRKPSQFLRHLRSLAGTTQVQDNLLRQLWLQRLPPQVQAILQTQAEIPLNKVATLADKITEVTPPTLHAVSAVNAPQTPELSQLTQRINELAQQMAALQTSLRTRSVSRGRPDRQRRPSSPHPASDETTCWYHRRFREQAQKCTPPCAFSPNTNGDQ